MLLSELQRPNKMFLIHKHHINQHKSGYVELRQQSKKKGQSQSKGHSADSQSHPEHITHCQFHSVFLLLRQILHKPHVQLRVHVYLSFCRSQSDINQSSTICTFVMQLPHRAYNNYPNFGEFVTNSKCDIYIPL